MAVVSAVATAAWKAALMVAYLEIWLAALSDTSKAALWADW